MLVLRRKKMREIKNHLEIVIYLNSTECKTQWLEIFVFGFNELHKSQLKVWKIGFENAENDPAVDMQVFRKATYKISLEACYRSDHQ